MSNYILIVDDNNSDQLIAESICDKNQYPSLIANDAYEAIELMHEEEVQISMMIIDLQMPKMSGMELLKRIRQSQANASIPILIMSGRKQSTDIKTALNLGANDYIVKPVDTFILEEKVKKLMGNEDRAWKEYSIPQDDPCSNALVFYKIKITSISEIGVTVHTDRPLEIDEQFNIKIKNVSAENLLCKVLDCKKLTKDTFEIKARYVGIEEKQRKEIREVCKHIFRKYSSKIS